MSSLFGIGAGSASTGFYPETIDQSARFEDGDSANLYRDFSTGNTKTFTISFWFKRATISTYMNVFDVGSSGSNFYQTRFQPDDQLIIFGENSGSTYQLETTQFFRDTTNWYHFVIAFDTTQATASNRIRLYVNGSEVTAFDTASYPSQNFDTLVNSNARHYIGRLAYGAQFYLDGYLAEFNFIDGTQLTPSSFGESKNGTWIPKSLSSLTYGTNGFRLTFADSSSLGDDTSGNGNDFTSSGLASTDRVIDTPTNNFCTLNFLQKGAYITLSEGNLQVAGNNATNSAVALGTFSQTSGKWYFEVRQGAVSSEFIGVYVKQVNFENSLIDGSNVAQNQAKGVVARYNGAVRGISGELQLTSTTTWTAGDIIGIAFDMDNGAVYFAKNNTYLNSGDPTSGSSKTGSFLNFTVDDTRIGTPALDSYTGGAVRANFGQDSSFAGNATAQGNSDENGQGDFYYSPPTGYLALCSSNLPDTTISPNKSTQADDHFNTVLYTGNSGTQSITGVGFQPDWLWMKGRTVSGEDHYLTDSSRGKAVALFSTGSGAEYDYGSSLQSSFDADGFSLGNGGTNISGRTYVAWNWKAGGTAPTKTYKVVVVSDSGNKYRFRNSADSATFAQSAVTLDLQEGGTYVFDWSDSTAQGHPIRFSTTSDGTHGGGSEYTTGVVKDDSAYKTTITVAGSAPTLYYYCQNHSGMGGQVNTNTTHGSTNFDGSLLSVSQTNETAGFSIVLWNGEGDSEATVGHGLGAVPKVIIPKNRDATGNWHMYHAGIDASAPEDYGILLNANNARSDDAGFHNDTAPTSSVFTVGTYNNFNNNYVAYCFAEIKGYSKFGSFDGTSSADGSFVNLGFRPKMIIWKDVTTSSEAWLIVDTARSTHNPVTKLLFPSDTSAEYDGSPSYPTDFVSNGFKVRNASFPNTSGRTYIYMAWAEQPFQFSNAR